MRGYPGRQLDTAPQMRESSVDYEILVRQRDDAATQRDVALRERDAAIRAHQDALIQRQATVRGSQSPEQSARSFGSGLDPERPVGWESRKTYGSKIANGFFDRYLSGSAILEIGYKGGI